MKMEEAIKHKQERELYLSKFGKDEARRIQNESGYDMDISNLDTGEKPVLVTDKSVDKSVSRYPAIEVEYEEIDFNSEWGWLSNY